MNYNSKLSVTLDVGYIFDIISILNVKLNKLAGPKKDSAISSFQSLAAEIKNQIGQKLFDDIISSDEYKELYDINLKVFNLVDIANKDNGLAGDVARANTERFLLKNKLQSKFFGDATSEIKT